jgi:hypothetical protein
MKKPKLGFDTPPGKFPETWNADETLEVDINAIINKHVYLALENYVADIFATDDLTKDGHAGVLVGVGERFEKEIDLEEVYGRMEDYSVSKSEFLALAASFRRLAERMEKLAETAPE